MNIQRSAFRTTLKHASFSLAMLSAMVGSQFATAQSPSQNTSRMATYSTPSGDGYFALSMKPKLDAATADAITEGPRSIVIVADTSASQSGQFRNDTLDAVRSILDTLRPEDQVCVMAVDVQATPLSKGFAGTKNDETTKAVRNLAGRLPLGNTNLGQAIRKADEMLSARNGHRAMIYVGDGSSIGDVRQPRAFEGMVDSLRTHQVAVHSLAVGPTQDPALLATLANQTGGITLISGPNSARSPQQLAQTLALSAGASPLWVTDAKLPAGFSSAQTDRFPPLRVDRDSVLIGRMDSTKGGNVDLRVIAGNAAVNLQIPARPEASHPDFSFLPSLTQRSEKDGGLTLATAGSGYLRETARMITKQAEGMVQAGTLALKRGELKGAAAVAQMALQADPNNPQAKALARLAGGGEKLTAQIAAQLPDVGLGAAPAAQPAAKLAQVPPTAPPLRGEAAPAGGSGLGEAPFIPGISPDPLEEPSGLMDSVEQERAQLEGKVRAEVRAQLKAARNRLTTDPSGVAGSLKILLSSVQNNPAIDAKVRDELARQIVAAIQEAGRREVIFEERVSEAQVVRSEAATTERLLAERMRKEDRLKGLVEQFASLMREDKTADATYEIQPQVHLEKKHSLIDHSSRMYGHMAHNFRRSMQYKALRERNFVDALLLVEEAYIPFVDEPPLQYPDSETWRIMSNRRLDRYGSIELTGGNDAERRIYKSLDDDTTMKFLEEPLESVIEVLRVKHGIPIVLDIQALDDLGVTPDIPVTKNLENVSLRSALRLMLQDLQLTYMIKDEVLQITTPDAADANLVTKVYPVGDLVVPVISLGGSGLGGAGGGGGGFGGGGQQGGGGGGFGGGGGGGFGGGGGGGQQGGFFAVPDDASISTKKAAPADEPQKSVALQMNELIKVSPAAGESEADAWDSYFEKLELADNRAMFIHDGRLRLTVRQILTRAKNATKEDDSEKATAHLQSLCDLIAAALRHGHGQAWMYHGYAFALEGIGAEPSEIERVVLSAVDFADSPDELLNVARHLNEMEMYDRAISLCKEVARIDPYKSEAYLMALGVSRNTDDLDAVSWACAGVLKQAWPEKLQHIEDRARLTARATYRELLEEGRVVEAKKFEKQVMEAFARDCMIRVSWTGKADIDLMVEEPSGTVCSFETPRSAGGGVLLGDNFSDSSKASVDGFSETYICPEGFTGQYRLMIKRIWGEVSAGSVTVEVLTDAGRPQQRYVRRQVPLSDKNAVIELEVKEGRRQQEVAEAKLVDLRKQQAEINDNILAQSGTPLQVSPSDLASAASFFRDQQLARGGQRAPFNLNNPAVGFRPEITILPEGASLQALGIISADRRYVRISPGPFFSQIGDVATFNFVDGSGGTGGGGGGGGGGGLGFGGGGNF